MPSRSRLDLTRLMGFDADTALHSAGDGVWEGRLAEGWDTPRGPLGGYVMAILMRGLEEAVADPGRQARSVTMHFLRPPDDGPVAVRAKVERAGRTTTSVTGRLEQEGKLIGLAIAAYSTPWESPTIDDSPMPDVGPAPFREAEDEGFPPGSAPPFAGRLSMHHRFGAPPFTGADHGEVGGWIGLREERPIDALAVAVIADAWYPAPWPRLKSLAPAPTIDLTVHFRAPLPLEDGLLLGRFRCDLVRDGFFDESGELWAPDGTLVAQSRQLGLLLGAEV